jgi:phage terminase large subunit-like protein
MGEIMAIGTRWHMKDYWGNLIERDLKKGGEYVVKIYRALEKDGTALWPEMWSERQLLARKKEIGSLRFNCLYMNDPSGFEGAFFKTKWLSHYNPEILKGKRNLLIIQGVDPNVTEEPESDNTAIVTLAFDPDYRNIYVLDMYAEPLDFPNQLKKIKEYGFRKQWNWIPWEAKPWKIGIESYVYQAALAKSAFMQGLPVIEVKGIRSKIERMLDLQPGFETGRIMLPDPEIEKPNWYDDFKEEYATYPRGRRNDRLDGLNVAVSLVDEAIVGAFGFGGGRNRAR